MNRTSDNGKEPSVPEVRELTREEAWEVFDRQSRSLLGLSAAEFLRAYEAGEIVNDPETYEVTKLEMMLPLVR